ncbi:hypothetical protein GCM10023235_05600 [Kitasatospora terrestris]|uniref:Uncharacterized protein n=1 Tax=Kitasatospora terrestris TaxID=258051 RepID=A0ABP9D7Y1_9ACTN
MRGHTIDHRIGVSLGNPYGPPINPGVDLAGLAVLPDGSGLPPATGGRTVHRSGVNR